MEFYVVDPKNLDFDHWTTRVRDFLTEESLNYVEATGQVFYLGDDVAIPWDEESVLFSVAGDDGGIVEVRDADEHFYVFIDDLDLFDEREVKDAIGYRGMSMGALFGFRWNSQGACRFHTGPSVGNSYFCDSQDRDVPPRLHLEDVWAQFFRVVYWLGGNTSRVQDLKGINVEKVFLDFEVDVSFKHPASLDGLFEVLVDEEGYEKTRTGLRATFKDRDLAWIQRLVSLLPTDSNAYEGAFFRAVWRGLCEGVEREVYYVGVERRQLKPFVQLPVHRTSKDFMSKFRNHFKGHRIDRQEYSQDG
ncbi:MAG: hypothetical protein CMH52_09910 [Myxococcales bacterium]|nr:hypothetical protein [Myxococcales bacterium]|tara:strand:- start:1095 stop:2006 length:912 start_codon:yes stop_codon:yes gene_type:complete